MDVSENNGTPKSSILIGFSIIFTIHFGVPLFLETPISKAICQTYQWGMCSNHPKAENQLLLLYWVHGAAGALTEIFWSGWNFLTSQKMWGIFEEEFRYFFYLNASETKSRPGIFWVKRSRISCGGANFPWDILKLLPWESVCGTYMGVS